MPSKNKHADSRHPNLSKTKAGWLVPKSPPHKSIGLAKVGEYWRRVDKLKTGTAAELLTMIEQSSDVKSLIEEQEAAIAERICSNKKEKLMSMVSSFD
jgi:hypothetical protein